MAALDATFVTVTVKKRRLVEGLREVIADIQFGSGSETYPTDGIPLPALSAFGINKEVMFSELEPPVNGYVYKYDRANHKLLIFEGDNDNSAHGPLVQVANTHDPADTIVRLKLTGN